MAFIGFLSIIQIILSNTLLFTIGIILRRNQILLEYFGIYPREEHAENFSIKDLKSLITFSGQLLQYIAILNVIIQVLGVFTISNNSF